MLYIIRDIIFVLLAIIGLAEVASTVIMAFLHSKHDKSVILVIPLKDHMDDIEQLLRSTAAKVRFMGKRRWEKVVCINCSADRETLDICSKICDEFPFMEIVEKKDIVSYISAAAK